MSLNVIGVNVVGDSSAALVVDGELVNCVEEERFVRVKHAREYGSDTDTVKVYSPVDCIAWCLRDAEMSIDDIDSIVIGWKAEPHVMERLHDSVPYHKDHDRIGWEEKYLVSHSPDQLISALSEQMEKRGMGNSAPISCVPHHLSHAAAAYASGWDTCAILTVDGHGDTTSIAGWYKNGGEIEQLFYYPFWNSLGWFYTAMTEFLGMRTRLDESKVMNLSNFGKSSAILDSKMDKIVSVSSDLIAVDASYLLYGQHHKSGNKRFSDKFVDLLGQPYHQTQLNYRTIGDVTSSDIASIALAAQKKLEEALLALTRKLYNETHYTNLVVGGGVFLNCMANSRILADGCFNNMFAIPASNDAGVAIGAALAESWTLSERNNTFEMMDAYYGPEHSDLDIRSYLDHMALKYQRVDPTAKAVELLCDNEILGWFQGRREIGPRALMNTSILADPTDVRNFNRVNKYIKDSVLWRDRSPSVTQKFADDHFTGTDSKLDRFMLSLRGVDGSIPAVTSCKGECRPQIIEHPILTMLEECGRLGALLNTSLNYPGRPMPAELKDLLDDVTKLRLKHLIVGDYYVRL